MHRAAGMLCGRLMITDDLCTYRFKTFAIFCDWIMKDS